MLGPLVYIDADGRRFRALAGRWYRPVGIVFWTPPPGFYSSLHAPRLREAQEEERW